MISIIAFFMIGAGRITFILIKSDISFFSAIIAVACSIFSLFLLIPLHEAIHGLAFQIKGAKKVKFGVIWHYLAFYAVAVDFKCNYRQFRFIALAPCIIISLLLLGVLWLVSPLFQIGIILVFFQHYLACVGDILLLSFFYRYRFRNVITWDDIETQKTYFFEEIPTHNS